MAQAATYSNMSSRPTHSPNHGHPSSANHSASPSTSTIQSRQSNVPSTGSTAPTSSARNSSSHNLSPITVDLYDGAARATANKKPISDSARRKRPAFLALSPEHSETVVEGRTLHTRRDKDQLRKSSPTVGDQFTFVPGEPPPEGAPPHPRVDHAALTPDEPTEQEFLAAEPLHLPPSGPLPKPPSRSPSRSRSPPPANSKPSSRAPSRNELSRAIYAEHSAPTTSPSKQPQELDEQLDQSITLLEEENRKLQTPSPPQEEELSEEQILEERILQEQILPPPPIADVPPPRKQKSSSSVRSQIIALPETARLRKQASAEGLLRKQPSAEMLAVRRADASIPALPIPMGGHIAMSGQVRGNAFGKQGSRSSLQTGMRSPPPRTSSLEGLSDRSRKRSATDLNPSSNHDAVPMPLRPKRSISRSASDAHRPVNLRMRRQPSREREREHTRENIREQHSHYNYIASSSVSLATPTSLTTPISQEPSSAQSDSWPLTPEPGQVPERTYPRPMSVEPDPHEQAHSRNLSSSSFNNSRMLSPDHTPRASRTGTPYGGTPRSRSRTNTLHPPEAALERDFADDSMSMAGSVAPSVMSAQWHRTPRERLGLGTRVSRAEILPWEMGAPEDEGPPVPPKPKTPPKSKKFSMFPSRVPSRMKDLRDEHHPDSPPRSPLLTEKFLVDVKDSLPESPRRNERADLPDRPSTSLKNRDGAITPDWASRKKAKKDKDKKERFPTLGEMISEYKGMTNTWYTSAYAEEAKEQELKREVKEGKRPATGTTTASHSSGSKRTGGQSIDIQPSTSGKSTKVATPRPSGDMGSSVTSSSNSSKGKTSSKKQKKKSSAFPTMKEMWSEYKNMGNQWYVGAYQTEAPRDIDTPHPSFP